MMRVKFGRLLVLFGSRTCLVLLAQAMPAFAQQQASAPTPETAPSAPPASSQGWPSEFRRPRSVEDMRRWQREHAGMPAGRHTRHHLNSDEQAGLRRDLSRAQREIYRNRGTQSSSSAAPSVAPSTAAPAPTDLPGAQLPD